MPVTGRKRIGEHLRDAGLVTEEQLDLAQQEVRRTGELIGEALVRLGVVRPDDLTVALARQEGIPFVDLDSSPIDYALFETVPEAFLRKHRIVPVKRDGFTLTAATSDVGNLAAVDELQRLTKLFVTIVAARDGQIDVALERFFARPMTPALRAPRPGAETPLELVPARPEVEADHSSVIRLVDELFQKAAREAATDIHIEPQESALITRFRYDGLLQAGPVIPRALLSAVVTRIKIMANLNISESRLPQDGRILFEVGGKRYDLRVSTFPTVHGENVSLRVLDKSRTFGLETLGLSAEHKATLRRLILRPHGLILVTGPTGSGKTTTLYSALLEIDSVEKNIMTLEDPVEYELQTVRQAQINVRSGFTFAAGLRAILRHDPDVILVGEMRDTETVEISIRAALTGHLVFSTLHTNDAAGAVPRLGEMGVEPYLVGASLLAVVAQRLVRVICANCRMPTTPEQAGASRLGEAARAVPSVFVGKGCPVCNSTGYRGRTGVFELLEVTPRMTDLISRGADLETLRRQAREDGMEPMARSALRKINDGVTTVDEVVRVIYSLE
ncbi:MAG: type II/IV secretion system protein [Candidatus Rokubacteria bacterium]|nr:type II/IV secretion system protein [Candidatus Rokubacteria bacterium]